MSSSSIAIRLREDVKLNITHYSQLNPWTASLLELPQYEPVTTWVRVEKPTGEDSFFGGIIKTPSTVTNMLCLRLRDLHTLGPRPRSDHPDQADVCFIFSLARAGLQGHPNTAHGGFLNVLFDEMMGQTMTCHYPPTPESTGGYFTSGGTLYTANLNINFRAPMPLPGTYLYRGWMTKQERRKSWVEGEIVDVDGKVLAEGTSLWVTVEKEKKMDAKI